MVTTHFEDTTGAELTTIQEESDLLADLVATGRVDVQVLGTSRRYDYPIHLVAVTTDETPNDAPNILFIGLQHGNEPIGREALLSAIRDLAETTDSDLLNLMGKARMCFIPAASPGSFPDYRTVAGGGGYNMNREHLSLAVRESEYVQQAITDLRPVVVIDCHEHFSPADSRLRVELLQGGHPGSPPGISAVSDELMAYVQADLDAEEVTHGIYSPAGEDVRVMRSMAAIRGAAFLLVETPAREDIVPRWTRFEWYRLIIDSILRWTDIHITNAASRVAAGRRAMAESDEPLTLGSSWVLNPRPVAYELPAPGPHHLDVFGLDYTSIDDAVRVPMDQYQAPLVAYLLDEESPEPVAAATRIAPEPPDPILDMPKIRARVDGQVRGVAAMTAQLNGQRRTVSIRPRRLL